MRKEIRICGFGGQGVILAGVILGEAAVKAGYWAVQTQSYGPESRGGATRSEVLISDEAIDYPRVTQADFLVALSQPAFDKYGGNVTEKSQVVVDSLVVAEGAKALPFAKTAEAVGHQIVTNIVMLGYLSALLDIIPPETIEETVLANIPKGTEELNLKALRAGRELL
ncbi:MAG: 2-oxoacid:ferredoxin oxidoreductase subunit gamma [Proteobacteria bacterium]|jgi:2-oxoglutarate ferredoxin oxidoreductase subunit gamma|nr:2-oxoacid:ferredoxin oxidoreductase subunit gamma [Pseudomonadota bacterium]